MKFRQKLNINKTQTQHREENILVKRNKAKASERGLQTFCVCKHVFLDGVLIQRALLKVKKDNM